MRRGILRVYVLFSLSKKRMHGYELLKHFRTRMAECGGRATSTGELYSFLAHMEKVGQVRSEWTGAGRRRRVFSLTPSGRATVAETKNNFRAVLGLFRQIVPEVFGKPGGKEGF